MAEKARIVKCPACGDLTTSVVYGVVTTYDPDNGPPAEFSLVQCGSVECQTPIVQVREDYGGGFEDDKPAVYYPSPRRLSYAIPDDLRDGYMEARKCLDARAYDATLVMVRRLLEGTCADQGSTKRTLAESLAELEKVGKIDGMLAEWANLLRIVGNEGAHFSVNAGSVQDATDALDFAEALLDHLYVFRKRFDDFKARRPSGRT